MRFAARGIIIAGLWLASGPWAQAQSAFGVSDDALFVSSTTVSSASGTPYALCLHTRTFRLLYVPFYRRAVGAAYSPITCQVETLIPVPVQELNEGVDGVRPWLARRAGSLTLLSTISGFWGWLLIPAVLLPLWVARAFLRKEASGREALLEQLDAFTETLSRTLGLIAGADGKLTRQQFARIRAIVIAKTGEAVTQEEIMELALPAEVPLDAVDLSDIGEGLTYEQKINVADAAQILLSEAETETPQMRRFVERLLTSLASRWAKVTRQACRPSRKA